MKICNSFVVIADDSRATMATIPPLKEPRSLARMHYDLLIEHPYEYDIDSFNFEIFCQRNQIAPQDRDAHRAAFFSKGHPCMRASPLTKSHGFGAHYNSAGKIAIYPVDSRAYDKLARDPVNRVDMAMRSKRPSPQTAGANPGGRPQALHSAA